jgi:hypothetical protein
MKLALIMLVIACKLFSGLDVSGEATEDEMPVQYHVAKYKAESLVNTLTQVKSVIASIATNGKN